MIKFTLFWLFTIIFCIAISKNVVKSQQLMMKNYPRPGRASRAPDDFENFFLKASKSVPRIGRRDYDMNANYYAGSYGYYHPNLPYPKIVKKLDSLRGLSWQDLADKIEYYPEILISPGVLANAEFKDVDIPFEDKRMANQKMTEQNKEITEYRLQPET